MLQNRDGKRILHSLTTLTSDLSYHGHIQQRSGLGS
jgi:hypothetical protein